MWREETTNWFGNYAIRFDGSPDLSGYHAQVSGSGQGSIGCGAVAGPAQYLRLVFRMFDMELYNVDPLLSEPAKPMSFCQRSATPLPASTSPPSGNPPAARLPPLPPMPFLEASARSHQKWTMPEYKCYWKAVSPDAKVVVVFGLLAGRRYGADMTLWQSMQGRGDSYRTPPREGTTALLNSYNSLQFPYHPLDVIQHLNWALMGSTRQVLLTALRFTRANSGCGTVTCRFTYCN